MSETQSDTVPLGTTSDFGFSALKKKNSGMGQKHVIGKMCVFTNNLIGESLQEEWVVGNIFEMGLNVSTNVKLQFCYRTRQFDSWTLGW